MAMKRRILWLEIFRMVYFRFEAATGEATGSHMTGMETALAGMGIGPDLFLLMKHTER